MSEANPSTIYPRWRPGRGFARRRTAGSAAARSTQLHRMNRRRLAFAGAGPLAVLLVATVLGAGGVAAQQPPEVGGPVTTAHAPGTAYLEPSSDEMADAALAPLLGERYAGSWTNPDTGRRQVRIVEITESDSSTVSGALGRDDVDLVESRFSLEELRAVVDEITAVLLPADVSFGIGPHVPNNLVSGTLDLASLTPAIRAELDRIVAEHPGMVELRQGVICPVGAGCGPPTAVQAPTPDTTPTPESAPPGDARPAQPRPGQPNFTG